MLQSRGQRLVGQIHVREQGVAAKGRHLAGDQHRPHRRVFEIGRVAVPEPAEIDPLVLALDDRGDLGKSVDPFDERVFDRLAKAPRKADKPLRRQILTAKEDDEMVEPSAPNRRDRATVKIFGEVDPADLGAQRPGNRADLERIAGHGERPPVRLTPSAAPARL